MLETDPSPHAEGKQSLGFALDIGTQISTADLVLESLRGVAWLLAKLRKGRTWAEVGRKMPVLDMKSTMSLLYGQRRLLWRQSLGAEQLPHESSQQSAGRLKNKLFIPAKTAAGSAVL